MIHLTTITPSARSGFGYPFSLPLIQNLQPISFTSPVTFFVGENGSGKSTLLEGIAAAANLPAVGGASVSDDPTLASARMLGRVLRLRWTKRTHRGFFMRSEDFFNFARLIARVRAEAVEDIAEIEREYRASGRSDEALALAKMPHAGTIADIDQTYKGDLDARSHGESFLQLFESRFVPGGLYLLDEPEAPLSPQRQLALIAMLKDMIAQEAQFIIATHSPIIMAFPDAVIYDFDTLPPAPTPYAELPHVQLTRDFLKDPQRYLRFL